jgi:hypothetical protein
MAILNYTTKIAATQSIGEIQQMLSARGANKIVIDYQQGQPVALSFAIELHGIANVFVLPAKVEGVLVAMKKDPKVKASFCTPKQASNVAWRILKDWIAAQMAIYDSEQVQLDEIFLPYLLAPSGQTVYQLYQDSSLKLLQ